MEMRKDLICQRNENPDTCIFCQEEGQDYCTICADALTPEEYETIQRIGLPF